MVHFATKRGIKKCNFGEKIHKLWKYQKLHKTRFNSRFLKQIGFSKNFFSLILLQISSLNFTNI